MNAPGDDPYACLGISPGASLSDIRKAYKRAVQRLHPDRNPSPDAHAQFLKVQWAYQVLQDGSYSPPSSPARAERDAPSPPPSGPPAPVKGKEGDATIIIGVPLEEAGRAHERIVSTKLAQPCEDCSGTGCHVCGGAGQVMKLRKWRVIIPPRTPDGAWIIGSRMGHRGARFGSAGDVRVQVKWTETGVWKWKNSGLVAHVRLSRRKMKKGGTHPLRMPDGRWAWWTVPPNTIEGQVFQWGIIQWSGMTSQASLVVERGWSMFSPRGRRPPRKS